MASTSTLGPVSSSIRQVYDVFLSFYGEDTRNNFVDHLHAALKRKGINSFKDDEKLERGKFISPELMQAIQDSQYAIVVISKRYAFSKWCLIELTKIMECKSETGLKVLPIFHNVDPSDVRKHNDSFEQAFVEHGKDPKVSKEQMETWKTALTDVGNVAGWPINNSSESPIIEDISRKILEESRDGSSNRLDVLVGIGSRVEEIISFLRLELEDFRIVGICGMGGVGKTTLARVVYDRVSPQFEARCFVANIREETKNPGLVHLQTQIISKILGEREIRIYNTYDGIEVIEKRLKNKNVFIVLDDVESEDQMKVLVGNRDWFSPSSRVILTTRNRHLLQQYDDVIEIYELKELSDDESLELFSWKAFKKDHPPKNYMKLSKDIVGYAQCLPLALEIFGSCLYSKPLAAWKAARKKLKAYLDPKIFKILRISYDGLNDSEKELFLDIAYLFKGQCSNNDVGVLKVIHPCFDIDIENLKDQCLIKHSKECFKFYIHDLLQEMGQQIVHQESPSEPGKRSRLGCFNCIDHISKHNSATDAVEKFVLQPPFGAEKELSFEIFSKMTKLKMLMIGSSRDFNGYFWAASNWNYLHRRGDASKFRLNNELCFFQWFDYLLQCLPTDFLPKNKSLVLNSHYNYLDWHGNASKFRLSNELCFLQWPGYPLRSLPTNFQPKNLVELRMPHSHLKGQWGGWKDLIKLKHVDLSYSVNLTEISDLSGIPNLEVLNLHECTKLGRVHASVGFLKRLRILRMRGCQCLEKLPDVISLKSLVVLDLVRCSRLKTFPNIEGHMTSLKSLDLTETLIRKLPYPYERFSSLRYLSFSGFSRYSNNYDFYYKDGFPSLLHLLRVGKMDSGHFKRLQALDMEATSLSPFRCFISRVFSNPSRLLIPNLSFLATLDLSYCNLSNATFPDLSSLSSIQTLNLSGNKLTTIPYSICKLPNLVGLHLRDCKSLQQLELLSCLRSLKVLNLAYCNLSDGMIPDNLGFLSSLKALSLSGNKFRKVPYLVQLSMLYKLVLNDCAELKVLPELPLNLFSLDLINCPSLEICCCEMDPSTSSGRLSSNNRSFMVIYFDSDGRPYKIPHVHKQKNINGLYPVTVGIARASGIPDWFNRRITSSFGTIKHHLQLTRNSWRGCVLLILYEVHEYGSSDNGTFDGSTRTLPQFFFQFQLNKIRTRKSLLLCAPEVPSVGLNGLWVFINRYWLHSGSGPEVEGRLKGSIESCSLNVEVRECGARSVNWKDFSKFSEVINSISPHPLDFISWLPLATCIRQRDLTNLFSV